MSTRVFILGSTGSIGTNALRVVENLRARCQVVGLAAGMNVSLLVQQAQHFSPRWIYSKYSGALRYAGAPEGCEILPDQDALCQAVASDEVDVVLCAISGTAGLKPVLSAIQAGKTIALASKEVMVMAGALVTEAARKSGARILPVDSEHCAIFQCLEGNRSHAIRRILLTCSGGPFHSHPEVDLSKVTLEQTLKHPTWNMGRKITIDCASLMNKGLEMIEAVWFFQVAESHIEVVIHPQSIVHSMVEFQDGSVLAQIGDTNMCIPIQYCLTYPERLPGIARNLNFADLKAITFQAPDTRRFPALEIARNVLRAGGASGAIFNAANEVAVERFCQGTLGFGQIPLLVEETLDRMGAHWEATSLDAILEVDKKAREFARGKEFSH